MAGIILINNPVDCAIFLRIYQRGTFARFSQSGRPGPDSRRRTFVRCFLPPSAYPGRNRVPGPRAADFDPFSRSFPESFGKENGRSRYDEEKQKREVVIPVAELMTICKRVASAIRNFATSAGADQHRERPFFLPSVDVESLRSELFRSFRVRVYFNPFLVCETLLGNAERINLLLIGQSPREPAIS